MSKKAARAMSRKAPRAMSNKARLKTLLKEANLMEYQELFLTFGADCVEQLAVTTKYEFQELLNVVGMSEKPLHIRRLLKALDNMTGQAPDYDTRIQDPSQIIFSGQPEFKTVISDQWSTATNKKRVRSQFYGEVTLPCDSVFEKLLPKRTEDEHMELIKTRSKIYSKGELNKYQLYINACAEQFCLRDPLLLASKKELFEISKEAVRQSDFKFQRGHSVSQHATIPSTTNFILANKNREKRLRKIEDLEGSIERDDLEREVLISKVKDLSQAQKPVGIGIVKTQLDVIEEHIFVKRKKLKTLNDSQKRSERYFLSKIQPEERFGDPEIIVTVSNDKKAATVTTPKKSQPDCTKLITVQSPKTHISPPIQINSKNYTDHSKSEGTIHICNSLRSEQYNPNSNVEIVMNDANFEPIAGTLDVLSYNTSDRDENNSNEERYNSTVFEPEVSTVVDISSLLHSDNTEVATSSLQHVSSAAADTGTTEVDTSSLLHSVFTSAITQEVNDIYKMKEDDIVVDGEFSSISEENDVMTSFMDES